ncbi:MAG: lysophospholipid acyltransferase family protein [Mariprofundaceae bacterium]|nr:lysophospholipid acyltransferase family protein [Mariprofundaceae bacterium]
MKHRLLAWLIPHLIFYIYFFLSRTIRWEFVGERYQPACKPYILSFWHARILMMGYAYKGWNGSMLISNHRDGTFISGALDLMGLGKHTSRGSSNKGGARAFLKMIRLARQGHSLGITPDGPKGPVEIVQPGTVQLAKKSGLPLRAVCYASKRHWRVKSWDRFYIPKPFTRGVFVIGAPVYVGNDDAETLCLFQKAMDDVQIQADGYFS